MKFASNLITASSGSLRFQELLCLPPRCGEQPEPQAYVTGLFDADWSGSVTGYSQLSSCMMHVCTSIGKFFRSIGQESVRVSLGQTVRRRQQVQRHQLYLYKHSAPQIRFIHALVAMKIPVHFMQRTLNRENY